MNGGFDDPAVARQRRRVGLWALVAKALLLAVLVGAWWWWEQGAELGSAGALLPATGAAAQAAGPAAHIATAALAMPAAATHPGAGASVPVPSTGAPQSAVSSTSAKGAAGPVELCGVGSLPSDAEPPHLFEHAMAAAWPRVLAAMERSPAERSRAAALVLSHGLQRREAIRSGYMPPGDALPALVTLAQASPDPALLRWALSLCALPGTPAACSRLSAEAALTAAPDDVSSWAMLLETDPAQTARALRGAAGATRFSPTPSLGPWVEAATPADLPAYLRHMLLLDAQAMHAVVDRAGSGLSSLALHCRTPSADKAACLALADRLEQQAPDLVSLMYARVIGQANGWPQERVQNIRRRSEAYTNAALRASTFDVNPVRGLSCADIERGRRAIREFATYGELGALRRLAAASAPAAAPR